VHQALRPGHREALGDENEDLDVGLRWTVAPSRMESWHMKVYRIYRDPLVKDVTILVLTITGEEEHPKRISWW